MKNTLFRFAICLLCSNTGFAQTLVKNQGQKINMAPVTLDSSGNFDNYGGKMGIGISILDGIGMPVRFYLTPQHVLEGGVYLGGVVLNDNDNLEYRVGLMLGAGYSYFGKRFETKFRKKIRANGLALRFNYLTGDFQTSRASLGWAMETIRPQHLNRSFIFELGIQELFPNFTYLGERPKPSPGIYLRCHWNFFL